MCDDVKAFAAECDSCIGNFKRVTFHDFNEFSLHETKSPIEDLFLLAFRTVVELNESRLYSAYNTEEGDGFDITQINIFPQFEIGKYKLDFLIRYSDVSIWQGEIKKYVSLVAVELDGHEFHDKNEKQRRYEKARDRFLQKKGLRVFHYTGSEIVRNPFNAAMECIAAVSRCGIDRLKERLSDFGHPGWQKYLDPSGDEK